MIKLKIKLSELGLITVTLIQIIIASIISLIFQFWIPFSWQPLDTFLYGIRQHGDPGTNLVIFTISQWYFSFSLAWFVYRENPFINNFLIYSLIPLGIIFFYEYFFIFLYYDYIHVIPFFLGIYLFWKKKETLSQKYALYIIPLNISWLLLVYFFKLAYYNEELFIYLRNVLIYSVLWIFFSFLLRIKMDNKNDII
ncbi:MAG: hypothetical protein ACFFCV_19305 [Promethearchaeota archaeon]